MATEKNAKRLPEHGPLDANGREILLSLKNVDITFGKGLTRITARPMVVLPEPDSPTRPKVSPW